MDLVSVIIPIYKAERYLEECLDSLIHQTYAQLEIICVNDGSPDSSLSILRNYKNADKRIVILDKSNEGVSAARNDALKIATGEFIVFVDADDWLDENTIEVAVNKQKETNADIVIWSYVSEHGKSKTVKHIFNGNKSFIELDVQRKIHRRFIGILDEELAHPELADSLCPVWGKLYKRELLEGRKFIDLKEIGTYEDGFFNLEVFGRVKTVEYIDKPMYHYRRVNTDSQTFSYRPQLYEQWGHLFDLMGDYIEKNHLSQNYKYALQNRICLSILGLGLNIEISDKRQLKKIEEIKKIITSERYRNAYKGLSLKWFPLHWKIFYAFAKYNFSTGIAILAGVILKITSREI